MEVTSIKMTKDVTEIGFTEVHETQTITSTLVDAMTPAPEFQNAFGRLKNLANEVLNGLLKCEAMKKVKPTKINFKKSEAGALGCIISLSAEIETSNRPFHFNTPLKFALAEGQEESDFFLSGKGIDLLNELQKLAGDFMNGVRAQQELFKPDENQKIGEATTLTLPKERFAGKSIDQAINKPKPEVKQTPIGRRIRKDRKTCYDCNQPTTMVVEGTGYCEEHGNARLTAQEEE